MITLHPEVEVPITINVARSADEAERQASGEDLTGRSFFREEAEAEEPEEPEGAAMDDIAGAAAEPEEER